MKLHPCRVFIPALAIFSLSSCADPMMSGSGSSSNRGGYHSYTTLPRNHSGSAYYHQGRYYTGGQYQTGRYNHQGRQFTSRYYHNGQYYYGGEHKNFPGENHNFQHGDFPAGNYQDGNYQGKSWTDY